MATTDVSAASPTETDTGSAGVDEFLIAHGGPFYALQQRLGLLHERALNAGRRAAILVGLAWGVPLVLSAIAGHAIGPAATRPFLLDLGAWARFFIAIGIFVLMERMVEERLRSHLRQFVRAPLIAPGSQPAAAEAVARALRRRDLRLAELACVVAAYAITLAGVALVLDAEASSWLVTVGPEGARLTRRRLVVRAGQQPAVLVPAAALAVAACGMGPAAARPRAARAAPGRDPSGRRRRARVHRPVSQRVRRLRVRAQLRARRGDRAARCCRAGSRRPPTAS